MDSSYHVVYYVLRCISVLKRNVLPPFVVDSHLPFPDYGVTLQVHVILLKLYSRKLYGRPILNYIIG